MYLISRAPLCGAWGCGTVHSVQSYGVQCHATPCVCQAQVSNYDCKTIYKYSLSGFLNTRCCTETCIQNNYQNEINISNLFFNNMSCKPCNKIPFDFDTLQHILIFSLQILESKYLTL
jgi:hypothetical protein